MSPSESPLLDHLSRVRPETPDEVADLAVVDALVGRGDPFARNTPVHVTGSAVVVHPPSGRVLLRWHQRQQAWLQVGGHADPGETDPFEIARREAVEETGLDDLVAWPGEQADAPTAVHVAVVPVPASAKEPAHRHADVRFVLATRKPEAIVAESEHAALRWLSIDDAIELTTEDNVRETLARTRRLLDQGRTAV